MMSHNEATIVAIATPPGAGGIGIIRLSGPNALAILKKIFTPKTNCLFSSHRLYYGWITNPSTNKIVDEVLAVFMRGPHTYTREDVVEIHCHGSFILLQQILGLTQEYGARPASAGEFTKLAFLNGRIDLTQAEAVLELLQAKTTEGLEIAMSNLQGTLHNAVQAVCDHLISIKVIIEVAIDFPDDDIEIIDAQSLISKIQQTVIPTLENLISAADSGRIIREGISVVIIGRPNVGKSSLLNAMLREERAIVTAVPGTTRDTIEEYIDIKGIPVRIIDTAGIRSGAESVEEIGIQRSKEKLAEANLALLILDSSAPLKDEDFGLFDNIGDTPVIVVPNKKDIALPGAEAQMAQAFSNQKIVHLSAKNHDGIDRLEEAIFFQVTGKSGGWDPGDGAVPNIRHRAAMAKALTACHRVVEGLQTISPDLIAIDLQTALDHLGDIVGYTTNEDILDSIFNDFCIGK